jgi:hypothetical protein
MAAQPNFNSLTVVDNDRLYEEALLCTFSLELYISFVDQLYCGLSLT